LSKFFRKAKAFTENPKSLFGLALSDNLPSEDELAKQLRE